MSDFVKGMDSIGQLFPAPCTYEDYPAPNSAWEGVAESFRQAGNDLRFALKEYSDAKRENEQAP